MDKTEKRFLKAVKVPLVIAFFIVFIHLTQQLIEQRWGFLGIRPRTFSGLKGIFMAPFIHGDWKHVFSNIIPLVGMGTVLFFFYQNVANKVFIYIYTFTGVGLWLIGGLGDPLRNSFHIGISGVVYGLLTFVLFSGIFRRSKQSIILSLLFTMLYTGYFAGIVPGEEGISWEGHLSGAIVGVFVAFAYKDKLEDEEVEEGQLKQYIDVPVDFFLPRDIFQKTKWQRYQDQLEQERLDQNNWESDSTYQ